MEWGFGLELNTLHSRWRARRAILLIGSGWLVTQSSLFRTCGGLPSEQTVEDILDQGGLSSHSFADSFGDGFMVADVASMTPKFGW